MASVIVYTKSNCQRCHELTQWLEYNTIPYTVKSLDDPETVSQISQDPTYLQDNCKKSPCKIYPPVLYFPERNKYLQNQLFNLNGLRIDYLSRIFRVTHTAAPSPPSESSSPSDSFPSSESSPSSHSATLSHSSPFSSPNFHKAEPPTELHAIGGINRICRNELVENLLRKYILAIGISRVGGDMLYSIQIDKTLNMDLISQFICALSMFGEENLGKIDRILIQGLEIEMSVVTRHDLIFFVLFRAHMVQDHLDEESANCLEKFYRQFQKHIEAKHTNRVLYESFDKEMCLSIQNFLVRIGILECVDYSLEIPILRERK